MANQEKLLKEIKSLSDSIRLKNRALKLGIREREKFLETTFKPITEPLKQLAQNIEKPSIRFEGDGILPLSKYEEEFDEGEYNEEYRRLPTTEESEESEESGETEESEESQIAREKEGLSTSYEEESINPSNLMSKFLKESDSAEEAPYFEQNLYRAEVREDEDVHHAIITVTAENHDEAPSVRYEITGGNVGEVFAIDADTGEVTLAGPLDYENRKQYSLQLLVSDGESSSFATLIVRVLDVNDNPPVFEKSSYRTQITEEDDRNIPKKILQVNVTDGDKDRPRDVVYFLAGPGVDTDDPSNAQFSINSTTGEIYVLKPLDRDLPHGRSQWRFTVFGQDEGGQGLVGYADIQVNLKDINDNAPYFPEPLCYANVTENGTAGLLVIVMSAIDYDDPDEGGNAKLVYTIEKNVLDELSGAAIFSIEPSTGEVRTAVCCLDREKTPEYTLQVVAMDGGGLKGTGTVSILVSDINDVSPVFTKDKWITEVFEGVESLYNSILTVAVRDRDETNDFYYQVVDGSGYGTDMFSMVRNADGTGSLRVVKALDYEDPLQRRGLRFKIQVNDQVNDQGPNGTAEDSHISHSWVMVRVKDINDNPPLLDQGEARVSLKEDVRVGTLVETFTARDPDQGGEGRVVFALDRISDPGRHFKVSPEGRVTIQRPLDREAIPVHKLVVLATDEGEPQLTATALLTVTVIDVNDHAPSLLKEYTPVVTENSSPRVVVELFAQDLDEHSDGHGPPYTFSLDPSVDPSVSRVFRVQTNPKGDNERGVAVVSTLAALDREKQKEYLLPIVIQDSGRPPMVGTSTLTVTVGDINDNPMTPGSTHITAYKLEGRESEMVVGRVYATDLDDWDLPDKTFSWASTPESHFHLDLDTGGITMKSDTPEGEYHMRFVVRDTRRKESVESDVTVTVRTITRHAMANSQSITLLGITDRNFISSVNASASPLDVFKEIIAQVLNTSTNLVEVFHVKTDNRFPPQTDVRFSVRDHSQYFKPVRLSGLLLMHRQMVEQGLGVRVSRVGPDQCLSEGSASPECEISCHPSLSIPSGLPTSLNDVVVANTSGLAFPHFNTSVQCACSARDFKLPETCRSKPCLNRGSCLDTRHGPVCTCLPNYDGPRCQLVSRGFHGSGYAWYPGLEACNNSHLSLEFLASSNDGSLLYNGPIAPPSEQQDLLKDFIALELIEGTVQLLIDMGSGTVNLTLPTKVNDGEWHRIDVVWDTEEVKLVVDLCKSHPLDSSEHFWTTSSSSDCMSSSLFPLFSSQLNLDTPLQLGGALTLGMDPKQYGWEVAPRLQSFDGCIRNVLYNGELLDLGSPALWHDSEEGCPHSRPRCSESCSAWSSCEASLTTARCVCHSGYAGLSCSVPTVPTTFLPGGFVKYSLSLQPDPRHTLLQLRFRTRRPVGELFRLMDQHHKEYIILEISGSILQVRMNLDGDRPLETTVSLSHVRVDDGRWHGAKVLRHGSSLILQVDGGEGRRYNESFHFKGHQLLFIDKQEGVYAGGPTDYIGIKVNFAMASFEQGCLDDIRLNGRHLPLPPSSNSSQWGQAPVFRGVESHCHSRSVCAEVQCPETFVCQDIWNDYVCTCGVNQVATADGKACAARSECHSSPCLNGGICQDGGPGQQYRCLCPDSYTGQRCELAHERQTLKLGYPALFTIVGCLLLILLLVVLFVSYTRRRDSHIKKPAEDDVRENIIRYYDDGGGEEDLRGVDLLPLKVPTQAIISDSGPGTKPQVPELIEETSIDVRAEGCRRRIDVDVEICLPPSDDLRTYAFEGSCESPTGSLSSLDLDSEEKEDGQRLVLGPRFQNLVEIYSSKLEHGQLEDAKM